MRSLTLVLILSALPALVTAQTPKTFTPDNPLRAGEETILNARVVSVDAAGRRITVRGVDARKDGGRDATYAVGPAALLTDVRPGAEVLLTLIGRTVVDVKLSVKSGGEAGRPVAGPATSKRKPASPRPAVSPRPGASPVAGASPAGRVLVVPPGAAVVGVGPIGGVVAIGAPSPVPMGTPFPTPRPVPTPLPVGPMPVVSPVPQGTPRPVPTPVPVLLPAPPPTPSPGTR